MRKKCWKKKNWLKIVLNVSKAKCQLGEMLLGEMLLSQMLVRRNVNRQNVSQAKCQLVEMLVRQNVSQSNLFNNPGIGCADWTQGVCTGVAFILGFRPAEVCDYLT